MRKIGNTPFQCEICSLALSFMFLILPCFCPSVSSAVSTANPQEGVASSRGEIASSDESQIMQDRDVAIRDAVEKAKLNGERKGKVKKVDLDSSGKTQMEGKGFEWSKLAFWNRSVAKSNAQPGESVSGIGKQVSEKKEKSVVRAVETSRKKRFDWSSFFRKSKKAGSSREVVEERQRRYDQFPALGAEEVKQRISELKVEMKRDFLSRPTQDLRSIVERAIQVDLPAQIAHERIDLADRRIVKAFRDFFTEVSYTETLKDASNDTGPYQHHSWRTSLKQPLFRGGVLWNTFKMEMINREAAKKELEQSLSDLVASASNAYFEYERALQVLWDKKILVEQAGKLKEISDEKAKANLVSEIEKLNMDSLDGQVKYDAETARQDLELAKLELQRVLELNMMDSIEIVPMMQIEDVQLADVQISAESLGEKVSIPEQGLKEGVKSAASESVELERFIDLAYLHRPDLQVEAAKLKAARLTHKISSGKMLPEADLVIEFGELGEAYEGADRLGVPGLETTDPKMHHEWRIGAELSWNLLGNTLEYSYDNDQRAPSLSQYQGTSKDQMSRAHNISVGILDNLNSLAEIKETKIAVLEQVVQLDKTEREVIREVKEAYFNYHKSLIQMESSYKKMKYRERLSKLSKHRLDNNEIQISEYLQAEIDYAQERANFLRAMSDFYTAKVNLNRSIGIRDYLSVNPIVTKTA